MLWTRTRSRRSSLCRPGRASHPRPGPSGRSRQERVATMAAWMSKVRESDRAGGGAEAADVAARLNAGRSRVSSPTPHPARVRRSGHHSATGCPGPQRCRQRPCVQRPGRHAQRHPLRGEAGSEGPVARSICPCPCRHPHSALGHAHSDTLVGAPAGAHVCSRLPHGTAPGATLAPFITPA